MIRQSTDALAAAGDSAGAARLLLVVRAQAAAVAHAVHPGAAAAGLDRWHFRHSGRRSAWAASCLAVVCLILALARPQWGFDWEEIKQRGLDIVVAIDTSKSMLAEDIPPNRLARAKLAALELMQRAKSDRLGLVAFAGTAFLQCPLTIDDAAFRQSVEALDVNTIPQGGTALAAAIETALTAYKEGDNYKILVLFTDGEDHDSGALEAAENAAKEGLRIFTVGIGTAEGEIVAHQERPGRQRLRPRRAGQRRQVAPQRAAACSRSPARPRVASTCRCAGPKPLTRFTTRDWPSCPSPSTRRNSSASITSGIIGRWRWRLCCCWWKCSSRNANERSPAKYAKERKADARRRVALPPAGIRRPTANPGRHPLSSSRNPRFCLLSCISWFLLWPAAGVASPSSALREYKAGQYDQALKEYERLLQKKTDDPRLHFNAGAAAYRNQQFDEAAKQFNATLASPDLNLQGLAYYNEGNALYHLGERNPDPKQRTESWEKAIQDYRAP